jgi:hypothetical protein
MPAAFWLYLIGLFPIVLARTWRARIVALLFSGISISCLLHYVFDVQHSPDVSSAIQSIRLPVIGALMIAIISVVVIYLVDRKYETKA